MQRLAGGRTPAPYRAAKQRLWAGVLAVLLCAFAPLAHAEDHAEPIGAVKSADGFVEVARNGGAEPLAVGDPVFLGDELITGRTGSLGVTLKDSSRISLGPSSRFRLEAFEFDPAGENLSFIGRLAHGTLNLVSGVIAKLSPEAAKVETPVATIAVRGTNLAIRIPKQER